MKEKENIYKKKYELYDSLFSQNSIDSILNLAENYLNNPIFILDTSYRVITRSNLAKVENSSIETRNGSNYLLTDTINLMKKNKCIDNIYKSNNSFFHHDEQNLIFCSIRINDISIGYISVLQSKRNFQEEDLELTNILSRVLSIQMQKENLFISNSGLDEEYYLMDLLVNGIDNVEYVKERFKFINFNLNRHLLLLSIPFKQKYEDYRHNFGLKQLIESCKKILGNCISTYSKDRIIFLISTEYESVINENTKENLLEFLKLNNLRCGMSIIFQNLLYIKDYYNQSIYALELSSYMNSANYINSFEDYVEYYFFYISTAKNNDFYKINLSTLVHPWINKLVKYDTQNKTELFNTVRTYVECNRNANDTAAKLNIHRSTLFYRFNKIQNLLDISIENFNNLFKLEFSLKIMDFKKFTK